MNDTSEFEKDVRKRLIDLGISQTQLSRIIKIPRNRINDAIRGRREGRRYQQAIIDYLSQNSGPQKANGDTSRSEAA